MSKFEKAILRYEKARQLVRNLKNKRISLRVDCERTDFIDDPDGWGVQIPTGELCLVSVFNQMNADRNQYQDEYITYSETLNNMHCEGECCDSCHESYEIKVGSLADAKKEFGNSKRALSYIGKSIIKQDA